MKKILCLLLAIPLIFASCSKDDNNTPTVIYGCTDPGMFNYDPSATTDNGTCIPILLGCLDSTASNFNALANTDDGSCLPSFYNIAQGTWNILPDCDEIDLGLGVPVSLNDQMPESVYVVGNGDNSLSIDMNGSQVSGNIDNEGNILVSEQTISVDFSGIPIPVQVSGTGKIESENSGYMDLIYSGEIDIIPNLPIPLPFSTTCHIILSK